MTHSTFSGHLRAEDAISRDALSTVLVRAAARATTHREVGDPEPTSQHSETGGTVRGALRPEQAREVDAQAVARWFVDHFAEPDVRYPGVVVGSPSGAAVHLAAAVGVPWLPAGFDVTFTRPVAEPDDVEGAL